MTMVSAEVSLGLCGLATSRSPHTVLRQGGAERVPCASEAQARVRGSPRRPGATIAVYHGAGAGVQATGRDQGAWPLRSCAFPAAMRQSFQRAIPGRTPGTSSEASGSPAPLTTDRATCAYRRPCGAFIGRTQRGLMYAPGRSTPGPCQVFSPSGRATAGPQDWRGNRARPLPRRPMCDRRCPSCSPRGRRASPPMPWHR
jgi:hypothetical protein